MQLKKKDRKRAHIFLYQVGLENHALFPRLQFGALIL